MNDKILYNEALLEEKYFASDPQLPNTDLCTILSIRIYHKENASNANLRKAAKESINRYFKPLTAPATDTGKK